MRWPFSLRRRPSWAIAVYALDELVQPLPGPPVLLLPSRKLLRGPRHVHTRADPFLFADNGELFVLFEQQALDDPGSIAAYKITNSGAVSLGTILSEPFHLSYPLVFQEEGDVYLLPESQAAGALLLYKFDRFPDRPRLVRKLADGQFADPTVVKHKGHWYLFATTAAGLELFHTDDLVDGELRPHPASPITDDRRFRRSGGGIFEHDGKWIRPAQDGTERYGANVNLMAITRLTPTDYAEALWRPQVLSCDQPWNRHGGHHFSVATLGDKGFVAVDGQTDDHFIHKIVTRAWMFLTNYRPGNLRTRPSGPQTGQAPIPGHPRRGI